MKTYKYLIGIVITIVAMFALAMCFPAVAQTTNDAGTALTNSTPLTNAPMVHPIDAAIKGYVTKFSYWKLMILPITGLLCFVVKKFISAIPNGLIPIIGPILGGLLDVLASKFGFWTSDPAAGAMMGALATWAHQVIVQVTEPKEPKEQPSGD